MGDNKSQPSTVFGLEFKLWMENKLQYVLTWTWFANLLYPKYVYNSAFLEGYILGDAVRCREYPLGADQGAAAEVLVQRVDERNLAIIWQ